MPDGVTLPNPWLALPGRAPFVLPQDAPYVHAFNQWRRERCRGRCGRPACGADASSCRDASRVRPDYTPEPRLGPVDAPLVILQLNASFSADSREHVPDQLASLRDESHRHIGTTAAGEM